MLLLTLTLIIEHCNEIGVESILTKQTHKTGTDRLFEACELLKLDENEIVLNVQGDEPFIDPVDIQNLFNLLKKTMPTWRLFLQIYKITKKTILV